MHGFTLALALAGAFIAGVTMTVYVWWFAAPLKHENGNIFDPFDAGDDSLADMPKGPVTGRESGKVTPGNWAYRDVVEDTLSRERFTRLQARRRAVEERNKRNA